MASTLKPEDSRQVEEAVAWAVANGEPLELVGRGSKRALGRPFQAETVLDLSALAGVIDYEPAELVLTAGPATPMAEIEKLLAEHNQMLAFEPMDLTALLGGTSSEGSLAGALMINSGGPRRIKSGSARDHLLGFEAVSGRAEQFKSGARVVKNVTGYDLPKLICGSYGTLAAVTKIDVKVLPRPEKVYTVLVLGLDPAEAVKAMSAAMNSAHEVSAAAHVPADLAAKSAVSYIKDAGRSVTALRIEGFGPSVERRCADLRAELAGFGAIEELHTMNSRSFWLEVRDVQYLATPVQDPVWRISVPPSAGASVAEELSKLDGAAWFSDWAGGLIWLQLPASTDAAAREVRTAVDAVGGHATLVRATTDVRAAVPVFHPQPAPVAALSRRVKESFDPKQILNPGRMYAGV
ncbi:FAD-binding protein [Nisaea acidiphila]|uniref:FAD-binding protein n=1 Tax=Nisaea acidiphila TaxID=1862145 RepID=A0A9J7AVD4_9PROT|nr:FAD-binding protein [Nisaea acidiphila]UUX51288.1 FAD-binding protein [Nisaea acidiphila]